MKANILVVDDTLANLRLLTGMLRNHGYKVRGTQSGGMALTAIEAAPPDLILLDINMPDMTGYEVCRRLKRDAQTADIPVIFISALGETLDKVRAFNVGGVDYIMKPFQIEEVVARLETHLALRRLQRELQTINADLEARVEARAAEVLTLNATYERFVPREFLSMLNKERIVDVTLGDQVQQTMTVMFVDIRSFTTMSEQMTPQENFNFINSYLRRVSPVIREHGGFIDKYIGDGIMALFPRQPEMALQAALHIFDEVARYNQQREAQDFVPIRIGMGLHTGHLMLGIIGEEERMQGTVISDAVNLAARLEMLTRRYDASIIISERTLKQLPQPEHYHFRFLGKVQVKGKQEPVSVFEVFEGDPATVRQLKLQSKPQFEEGLFLYHDKKFAEASVQFNAVLEHNPADRVARLYLEKAAQLMVQGVPDDWTGVEMLSEK